MAFRVGYLHDLLLHGAESTLRKCVESSLYPEWAAHLLKVRAAIVLCTCGLPQKLVGIAGEVHQAAFVVAVLDLEQFVGARVNALN